MDPELDTVFVYGTLLLPLVQEKIVGRAFDSRPASLSGFVRGQVRDQSYPSLRAVEGGLVQGALLSGVSPAELTKLDAYEGDRYRRLRVEVQAEQGSSSPAWVWLLGPEDQARVTDVAWDLQSFERNDLESYLAEYEGLQ